jgi:hypothetical protein
VGILIAYYILEAVMGINGRIVLFNGDASNELCGDALELELGHGIEASLCSRKGSF